MLEVLGLDRDTEAVYRALLSGQAESVEQLCRSLSLTETGVRAALDRLFEIELVRRSADRSGEWRAIDPQASLRILLARENAELERRRAEVAASQADIASLIAERAIADQPTESPAVRRLPGIDAVLTRLEQLTESARTAILGITPGGAQSPASLDAARRNDSRLLERGVAIREIVQDACRNDPATAAHARWLTDAGGDVRAAPTLPHRLIVVDGRTAVVPIDPGQTSKGALEITDAGLVSALAAVFELVWETATPFGASNAPDRYGLTPRERDVLRLLASGITDEAAAARLAVSDRTVRRIMNDLCERLQATSRFEAGIKAARAGWLD
jgi:DNA-binding CsgD family transcriptional regulator/sugar-specific transcriptional regulator TrmB